MVRPLRALPVAGTVLVVALIGSRVVGSAAPRRVFQNDPIGVSGVLHVNGVHRCTWLASPNGAESVQVVWAAGARTDYQSRRVVSASGHVYPDGGQASGIQLRAAPVDPACPSPTRTRRIVLQPSA